MPDWLRRLCVTNRSMTILGLEVLPLSDDVLKLQCKKSDRYAWPHLPQKCLSFGSITANDIASWSKCPGKSESTSGESGKPEEEWTRLEHRFVEEMFARDPSMHELDKPD